MNKLERHCTVLLRPNESKRAPPSVEQIMRDLESNSIETKRSALKTVVLQMMREDMSKVVMTVIRFCVPHEDHELKKLLELYWEVVDKYDADGRLRPEMILVCNALRNNLNHSNEYVRGCTLRFLCKLKERELLGPLVDSIKANLQHRHPYVRRNAAMTAHILHRTFGDELLPDAPELMEGILLEETDTAVRRNAFLMLFHAAQDRAIGFLLANEDKLAQFGQGFQLVVLELIRKVCRDDPAKKVQFLRPVHQLLNSDSAAVTYEAASTLLTLSGARVAVSAAANSYVQLLLSQSDNNVKLIVLQRLTELKRVYKKVLRQLLMDLLRALAFPNLDIRKQVLDIALDLLTPGNVEAVVGVLKKEVMRTQEKEAEGAGKYRELLVRAIHTCTVRFPEVAQAVVGLLMEFLNTEGAQHVLRFVREIMETLPVLRDTMLQQLCGALPVMSNGRVLRAALWVMGEYAEGATLQPTVQAILDNLGPLPFVPTAASIADAAVNARAANIEDGVGTRVSDAVASGKPLTGKLAAAAAAATAAVAASSSSSSAAAAPPSSGPVTLADGSYASQTADSAAPVAADDDARPLRRRVLAETYYLYSVLATSLTKLALRAQEEHGAASEAGKEAALSALTVMCALMEFGRDPQRGSPMTGDSVERVEQCLRVLLDGSLSASVRAHWLSSCRESFSKLVQHQRSVQAEEPEAEAEAAAAAAATGPEALLVFRTLHGRAGMGGAEFMLDDQTELSKATGVGGASATDRAVRVHQLTGVADDLYAEALMVVHEYDIVLEIMVTNSTAETFNNCTVELATIGDLRIVERPQAFSIGPKATRRMKANIKVSSTEAGHIFGNIVYDSSARAAKHILNLNDIHINIMDYIRPATCDDLTFRAMWVEFEWENKIMVTTAITDLREYLHHLCDISNMRCLTPEAALAGDANVLAANLYARSIFGEDALLNLSVEKIDNKIRGFIRIRSKAQGIALSLGDRVSSKQRFKGNVPPPPSAYSGPVQLAVPESPADAVVDAGAVEVEA